jgi:hypothetical protein
MTTKRSYEFDQGYVKPVYRGVVLWNGERDDMGGGGQEQYFQDLIYEAIGTKDAWLSACHLKGIKVTIEIEEATRQ